MMLPLGSTLSPRFRFGAACFSPAEAAAGLVMCRAAEATACRGFEGCGRTRAAAGANCSGQGLPPAMLPAERPPAATGSDASPGGNPPMNGGGTPPASFLSGAVPLTGANVGGGMDDLDLEEILKRLPCGVAATPSQPTTAVATPAAAAGERAPPTWRRPVVLSSRNIIKGEGCTPPRCSAKLARASSKTVRAASCVASSHAASMKDTTASQKALLLPVYLKLVAYPAKHAQHECMDNETSGAIRRKYLISVHQCFGACPTKPRTSGNMP